MKSKIKVKVKVLIVFVFLSLFSILIIAPVVNLEIATYLNNKGSENAEAFYNNYMASPIKVNEKQGLYGYGESLIKGFEKYKIKFSGWGSGENTTPENMEKAMELFESILLKDEKTDYKDEYSSKSYLKLLDTSIATLDMDRLLYWIDWGKDKKNEEIKYLSKLYEAYYYFVQKDYKMSKAILDDFDEQESDAKYYQLMGDVNLRLDNVEKAKEYYQTLWKSDLQPKTSYLSGYFGGSNSFLDQYDIENHIDKSQGDYKVRGRVSHNGKGLPFVEVYLNQDIGVFSTGGEIPDAITDENGEFETLGLKQGVYEIGIGIHPSQLYNRVFLRKDIRSIELNSDIEFNFDFATPMEITNPKEKFVIKDGEDLHISWDEVIGADYYKIESIVFANPKERGGGLSRIPLKDENGEEKLRNNSMNFNIRNLDRRIGILSFGGEDEVVNSAGIFGSFIPEIEYPIIVNAYDREDNLIGSSLTLISNYEDLISVEIDEELTEGEKLILDKKYEEAISHYEDKLIENPKDKEALFYLVRFYSIGWKKGKKDIPKALKYAEVYDQAYKDYSLSFEVIEFMYNDEINENKKSVQKVLERIPEKDRDTKYYNTKAMYHITEGDFVKARESYEKATTYRSINLVYIDMYLEDYEKAISRLNSGQISLMKMNTRKANETLNNMDSVSEKDKNLFKKLLKTTLYNNLNMDEEKALYNKTLNLVESLELKNLIKEIGKEEYWDR